MDFLLINMLYLKALGYKYRLKPINMDCFYGL